MRVEYYISRTSQNPVKDFLNTLIPKQKAKIFRIIQNIETYGLNSVIPHLKKLTGTPFWEIRVLGQDNFRVIYIIPTQNSILLIHAFHKKTQKTPSRDILIAVDRYKQWKFDK